MIKMEMRIPVISLSRVLNRYNPIDIEMKNDKPIPIPPTKDIPLGIRILNLEEIVLNDKRNKIPLKKEATVIKK
ncbi:MAG: hypothetical protein ABH882_07525 [Candidatus Omnitrophota bacterium]